VSSRTPPKRGFQHGAAPPVAADAERLLATSTALLLASRERNQALATLDLERQLVRLEHEWAPYRGLAVHLERHGNDPAAPTVVVVPGLGDHARRHLGLAAALGERGLNSLLVDRLGHGISEGRRGDATLESDLGVVELAIALARSRSRGPVILLGDSLGGIISWCLLTREPDIDAAVCHCIGHPEVHPDASFSRKATVMRAVGRLLPLAPVSVRQIADYEHVAIDPQTKRYFNQQLDELFNFHVTARSIASYIGFRPGIPWESVTTPALVMIGAEDRMVTPELTRRALERARPPHATYVEVPGAGHQLFLDDLGAAIGPLADWLSATTDRPDRDQSRAIA
jgi:acylglycerol lipase